MPLVPPQYSVTTEMAAGDGRRLPYSGDMLDKGVTHIVGSSEWGREDFYHITQTAHSFKFVNGIFLELSISYL